jgi:hypothetical protein
MKQFIVTISLCVAFSAVLNAAQRKIAYDRSGKIFVADVDGTHSKKIADGAWPEISPDGTRVAFRTPVATGLWPVPRAVCQKHKTAHRAVATFADFSSVVPALL